jgi:hypothetical protein
MRETPPSPRERIWVYCSIPGGRASGFCSLYLHVCTIPRLVGLNSFRATVLTKSNACYIVWSALLTSGATRVMRASSAFYIAFATQMSRIWSAPHLYNIRVTFAQHSHNIRTTSARHNWICHALRDAFVARVSSIHEMSRIARRKCAGPWVTFGQYCIWAFKDQQSWQDLRPFSLPAPHFSL